MRRVLVFLCRKRIAGRRSAKLRFVWKTETPFDRAGNGMKHGEKLCNFLRIVPRLFCGALGLL